MNARTCHQCGTALPEHAGFCPTCGAAVAAQPLPPPQVSPAPAAPTASPAPSAPLATVAAAPPARKSRRGVILGAALVTVMALVIGWLVMSRNDDDAALPGPGEVFLEPAAEQGDDPFTDSVDTNTAPAPPRIVRTALTVPATTLPPTTIPGTTATTAAPTTVPATPSLTTVPAGATTVRTVDAASPGLYGGTRNNLACDREQMISFLMANPDKAAAWAGVQAIAVSEIPAYIRSLVPMVLRADTRVTNHGFRNGVAFPHQSVLQAGTAVLVDQYGIPRAKCSCGNPLTPPVAQTSGTRWVGDPWPGFDPLTVIVVVNVTNVVINDFTVVDLGGGYFTRVSGTKSSTGDVEDGDVYVDTICDLDPEAPECQPPVETVPETTASTLPEPVLGTGDIQFTLRWTSTADLDLSVLDPNGEYISFESPTSSSGGMLDVDSNALCEAAVGNPVENIFWPVGQSPEGTYQVSVHYYNECGGGVGPQPYDLTVKIDGVEVPLQPVSATFAGTAGQLGGVGNTDTYQVQKTAAPPPTTAAPTTPPTTTPTVTTPSTRVPVTTVDPIGAPPTTATPGATIPLDEYCAAMYPSTVVGATNPWYTLCMHDPTV